MVPRPGVFAANQTITRRTSLKVSYRFYNDIYILSQGHARGHMGQVIYPTLGPGK